MDLVTSKDRIAIATHQTFLMAYLSFRIAATTVALLAALHVFSPEFDHSWRMVSEYALGNYGWVLALMFRAQALSCIALFFAIRSQTQTVRGKIGLFFLFAACVGLTLAAIFNWKHSLHGLAAMAVASQAVNFGQKS